jgi:hypothetical protein
VSFDGAPAGEIAVVHDDGPDHGVIEAVHAHPFDVAPAAVLVPVAHNRRHRLGRMGHQTGEQRLHPGQVVGMDQLERVPTGQFLRAIAQHARHAEVNTMVPAASSSAKTSELCSRMAWSNALLREPGMPGAAGTVTV